MTVAQVIGTLFIGILTGYTAHLVKSYLDRVNEVKRMNRERVEELINLLHEYIHQTGIHFNKKVYTDYDYEDLSSPPIDKARSIARLHFPELNQYIYEISQSGYAMDRFADKLRIKRQELGQIKFNNYYDEENCLGTLSQHAKDLNEKVVDIIEPARIILAKNSIDIEVSIPLLTKYLKKYIKPN